MELNTPQIGLYPYNINKCLYQGETLLTEEVVKIESKYQFDSLLEEVKQFNSDSRNKEEGKYLKIQ